MIKDEDITGALYQLHHSNLTIGRIELELKLNLKFNLDSAVNNRHFISKTLDSKFVRGKENNLTQTLTANNSFRLQLIPIGGLQK